MPVFDSRATRNKDNQRAAFVFIAFLETGRECGQKGHCACLRCLCPKLNNRIEWARAGERPRPMIQTENPIPAASEGSPELSSLSPDSQILLSWAT